MATKANLRHAYAILNDKQHYKLIDVFNALCCSSVQLKDKESNSYRFIIRSQNSSVYSLWKVLKSDYSYMSNRTTITNCINRLIEMEILTFNLELGVWEIKDMDEMLKFKKEGNEAPPGYLKLRRFLFTEEFYNLPISDKKIIYMALCISSSKSFRHMKMFIANITTENNPWTKILNTTNIYYIKSVFTRVLSEYKKYFSDHSKEFRSTEIQKTQYKERYVGFEVLKKLKKKLYYKFFFKPTTYFNSMLSESQRLESLKGSCQKFYRYIVDTLEYAGDYIKSSFTDSIMISILSLTKHLEWNVKTQLLDRLLVKLGTEVRIASPHNFLNAILKTIV